MGDHDRLHRMLLELHETAVRRVARAEQELDELMRTRRDQTDDDEHDPEGETLSSQWSRRVGLLESARRSQREIEDALARWDAGTYGICATCGRPIPEGRLEARPFADRCVPCSERAAR